jgi:hypothetical protein
MTTSLNVAEMLALRWKRLNLTRVIVTVGAEMLNPCSLAVRENYYRGNSDQLRQDPGRGTLAAA